MARRPPSLMTCCGYAVLVLGTLIALTVAGIGWFAGGTLWLLMKGDQHGVDRVVNWIKDVVVADCTTAWLSSFDPDATFEWSASFRREWRLIKNELHQWEREGHLVPPFEMVDRRQGYLTRKTQGTWSTLWLKVYGRDTDASIKFPRTMELLGKTTASSAMFSILEPGKSIPLHRGENKAVLRYHLALEVPKPTRGQSEGSEPLVLHVADKMFYRPGENRSFTMHSWTEGGALLFDDTFLHYVTNHRRSSRRVILFMDAPRQDCSTLINGFFSLAVHHLIGYVPTVHTLLANANFAAEPALASAPTEL